MNSQHPPASIPTIVGLLLLLVSIIAGVYLSSRSLLFGIKADSQCQPINPQITNITHRSFDFSFTTSTPCLSSLLINDQAINNYYSDKSLIHYFSISHLSAQQSYTFSLLLNGKTYQSDQFQLVTASQPAAPIPESNLAWGRVFTPDRQPAVNSIVYLIIPGASPLSALVTQSGHWHISLALSFTSDFSTWFTPPPNTEEEIIVISANGQATQVTANTSANNPVPDIILGQNRFSSPSTPTPIGQVEVSPFPSNFPQASLKINNPQDQESIFSSQPQFFGTAPQNSSVIITINSPQTITGQTTSNHQGFWSWSPPTDLTPGPHTITVKTQDPQTGLWQTVTHRFTVYASQNQGLAFTSSPSATLAPTPTSPFTPTPTPTSASEPTPTLSPPSTPTSTAIPTPRTAKPSTDSGVLSPGYSLPTFAFLVLIFSLIVSGAYLLKGQNRL